MKATDTGKLQEIRDNGWNIYSCPRAERGGGGIGILFRDGLVLKQCPVKTRYKSFQVQEVLISDRNQPKRLCNVYRPPYTTKSRLTEAFFLSEFSDYLSEVMMKQGTPIIAGDLNFQIQDKNNFYAKRLLELLDSFDLEQRVPLEPTHQHGGTLDLVLVPRDLNTRNLTIFPDGTTSDHFLVQFELDVKPDLANSCARKSLYREYRDYQSMDIEAFKEDLRECDPDSLIGRDSEETIINIYRWLEGIVEKRVPKKRVRRGKKVKPWRDEELRSLLRERRQAERYWRKHGTVESKRMFNDLKKKFGTMDKEKRALFIKEDLDTVKDDPRALQRKLQKLLGKTETILPETTNSKKLADSFSQFFNSKVTKIRKFVEEEQQKYEDSEEHLTYEETEEQKYEDSEEPEELKFEEAEEHEYEETGPEDYQPSWTDFAIVYEEEIVSVIKSMSNKHCDLDPLPTSVVKECVRELSPVLTAMVNQSLQKSSVAETLQKALVFPTIKNPYGDREALTNYRPVSNIPFPGAET